MLSKKGFALKTSSPNVSEREDINVFLRYHTTLYRFFYGSHRCTL